MFPELGHLLLIAGVATSFVSSLIALFSLHNLRGATAPIYTLSVWSALISFSLILSSIVILGHGFISDDFSIAYVAQHSNRSLPDLFKIAAVWGGHEGSFLFMLLSLSGWNALLALQGKSLPTAFKTASLAVLSGLVVLLGVYCLLLSNPFIRQLPALLEGRDLNPMLQDIGLIFHPPLLYFGYIGFAAPLAFSVSALITQTPPAKWVQTSRQWTASAWAFLTAGIAIGAWWAYKELGWGGWWFWDPVENASLLPWLSATALLHCLIATQRDNALIAWSLLLSISTFSLSILGTFIVRSGVLTSVHAFASDPQRGTGLLIILMIVLLSSLLLFAFKAPQFCENEQQRIILGSRAFSMMCGAALLVTMALIVMIGTFYPMIYSSLSLGTLSVGAPYFNSLFVPIALVSGLLAAFSSLAIKIKPTVLLIACLIIIVASAALSFWLANLYHVDFSFAVMLAISVAIALILSASTRTRQSLSAQCLKQTPTNKSFLARGSARGAMCIGHIGLALVFVSAAVMGEYSDEISLKMRKGASVNLGPYSITHQGNTWHIGPNYTAEQIPFLVRTNEITQAIITPEKRHYTARSLTMSEAGIWRDGLSDIYITLGNKFDANNYAVRVQFKPLVNLLWIGAGLIIITGFMSTLTLALSTKSQHRIISRNTINHEGINHKEMNKEHSR